MEDNAVTLFRHYLRLKTVQPQPDYGMTAISLFILYCSDLPLFQTQN